MILGFISDTHGLLRSSALDALAGSDIIVHAGDVGGHKILEELGQIAPVHAVRGNTDFMHPELPWTDTIEIGDVTIHAVHIIEELDLDPAAAGIDYVVYGHTHMPDVATKSGAIFLNPGSAGPIRGSLPTTVARVDLTVGRDPEIIHIPL